MYKICIVITFFAVQLIVAQENAKDKPVLSEFKTAKNQKDTSARKTLSPNKYSLTSKVEETARPLVNSANVKVNIYRSMPAIKTKNRTEVE